MPVFEVFTQAILANDAFATVVKLLAVIIASAIFAKYDRVVKPVAWAAFSACAPLATMPRGSLVANYRIVSVGINTLFRRSTPDLEAASVRSWISAVFTGKREPHDTICQFDAWFSKALLVFFVLVCLGPKLSAIETGLSVRLNTLKIEFDAFKTGLSNRHEALKNELVDFKAGVNAMQASWSEQFDAFKKGLSDRHKALQNEFADFKAGFKAMQASWSEQFTNLKARQAEFVPKAELAKLAARLEEVVQKMESSNTPSNDTEATGNAHTTIAEEKLVVPSNLQECADLEISETLQDTSEQAPNAIISSPSPLNFSIHEPAQNPPIPPPTLPNDFASPLPKDEHNTSVSGATTDHGVPTNSYSAGNPHVVLSHPITQSKSPDYAMDQENISGSQKEPNGLKHTGVSPEGCATEKPKLHNNHGGGPQEQGSPSYKEGGIDAGNPGGAEADDSAQSKETLHEQKIPLCERSSTTSGGEQSKQLPEKAASQWNKIFDSYQKEKKERRQSPVGTPCGASPTNATTTQTAGTQSSSGSTSPEHTTPAIAIPTERKQWASTWSNPHLATATEQAEFEADKAKVKVQVIKRDGQHFPILNSWGDGQNSFTGPTRYPPPLPGKKTNQRSGPSQQAPVSTPPPSSKQPETAIPSDHKPSGLIIGQALYCQTPTPEPRGPPSVTTSTKQQQAGASTQSHHSGGRSGSKKGWGGGGNMKKIGYSNVNKW